MNISSVSSSSFPTKTNDTDSQLRNLENQKMSLNSQLMSLKNNDNLDQKLKEKKIETLEDQIEALNTQITALKKQQNTGSTDSANTQAHATESQNFASLPNHQPDEFVKSDTFSHSPSGCYKFFQDEQGKTSMVWDKFSDALAEQLDTIKTQ